MGVHALLLTLKKSLYFFFLLRLFTLFYLFCPTAEALGPLLPPSLPFSSSPPSAAVVTCLSQQFLLSLFSHDLSFHMLFFSRFLSTYQRSLSVQCAWRRHSAASYSVSRAFLQFLAFLCHDLHSFHDKIFTCLCFFFFLFPSKLSVACLEILR